MLIHLRNTIESLKKIKSIHIISNFFLEKVVPHNMCSKEQPPETAVRLLQNYLLRKSEFLEKIILENLQHL